MKNKIQKATINDSEYLAEIAKISFLDAHGTSAPEEDIEDYMAKYFNRNAILQELKNPENLYYLIYDANKLAGYSKIVFSVPNDNIDERPIAKLERFYLLKAYYGKGLAAELLHFNRKIAQEDHQKGIWLAVWIENQRAINFYTKNNFRKVGSYDYQLSATHANPNHIMYLSF